MCVICKINRSKLTVILKGVNVFSMYITAIWKIILKQWAVTRSPETRNAQPTNQSTNQPTQQRRMKRVQANYADVTSSKAHDVRKCILLRYTSWLPCAVTCRIRIVHCLSPQTPSSEYSRINITVLHLILCSKTPLGLRLPLVRR